MVLDVVVRARFEEIGYRYDAPWGVSQQYARCAPRSRLLKPSTSRVMLAAVLSTTPAPIAAGLQEALSGVKDAVDSTNRLGVLLSLLVTETTAQRLRCALAELGSAVRDLGAPWAWLGRPCPRTWPPTPRRCRARWRRRALRRAPARTS